jgi:peptide/nickel transport system substrate-binding protein
MQDMSTTRRGALKLAGAGGLALAGGSLLAACGGSDPKSSGGGTATTAGSSAATGAPAKGGRLTVLCDGKYTTALVDPTDLQTNTSVSTSAAGFAWEQLMTMDADNNLQHQLAEEITPDATAKVWTIRLKDGIEFHNGKTLGAEDVIYTFNRMSDPKLGFSGIGQIGEIAHMRKLDARTVRVTLKSPRGWLDIGAGDGGICSITPDGFDPRKPVGTGPFMVEEMRAGVGVTFKRFDNYHGDAAFLDEIVLNAVNDPSARLNALVSGEADVIMNVNSSQIAQIRGNKSLALYSSPTGAFIPFQMNTSKGPLTDVNLRQALRTCLDRKQVLASAYGNEGRLAYDMYAIDDPDSPHDPALKRDVDLEKAKALAAKSSTGTKLTVTTMQTGSEQAQVLAQNAQQAGIDLQVKIVDPTTLYTGYADFEFMTGDFMPTNRYLVTSAIIDGPHAIAGAAHFKDPEYGKRWDEASATTDEGRRKELIGQMQHIQFERGPFIIATFYNELAGVSAKTTGWPEHNVTGLGVIRSLGKVGFKA